MIITRRRDLEEIRQRAVQLVLDHLREYPHLTDACLTVAVRRGYSAESLLPWARPAQVDTGSRIGVTTGEWEGCKSSIRKMGNSADRRRPADHLYPGGY